MPSLIQNIPSYHLQLFHFLFCLSLPQLARFCNTRPQVTLQVRIFLPRASFIIWGDSLQSMAQNRSKHGEIFRQERSDSPAEDQPEEEMMEMNGKERLKEKEHDYFARDYITLKNRQSRIKSDNDESLMEYYTNEKYRSYLSTLKTGKLNTGGQEYKQLCEMAKQGHNICVFGKGSKIQLLQKIQKDVLGDYHAFHVKAYLPSVTEKKILSHFGGMLVDIGLAMEIQKVTMTEQLSEYRQILSEHDDRHLVIVIHSIDGPNLKNAENQQRLAELIDIPQVQLICSVDDIQTALSWSAITLQKLKLLFFNIDTNQPYTEQLKYCALKSEARESTEDSLLCVWQSLNKNQKQILRFIAQRELYNMSVPQHDATHYTLQQLLDKCIEEIVLSSDHQLRQNLLELLDHKVILDRSDDKKNKKIYVMKYEKRTLEKLLDLKVD